VVGSDARPPGHQVEFQVGRGHRDSHAGGGGGEGNEAVRSDRPGRRGEGRRPGGTRDDVRNVRRSEGWDAGDGRGAAGGGRSAAEGRRVGRRGRPRARCRARGFAPVISSRPAPVRRSPFAVCARRPSDRRSSYHSWTSSLVSSSCRRAAARSPAVGAAAEPSSRRHRSRTPSAARSRPPTPISRLAISASASGLAPRSAV